MRGAYSHLSKSGSGATITVINHVRAWRVQSATQFFSFRDEVRNRHGLYCYLSFLATAVPLISLKMSTRRIDTRSFISSSRLKNSL